MTTQSTTNPQRQPKAKWDMPVSKAYFKKLETRIQSIGKRLPGSAPDASRLVILADRYISDGRLPAESDFECRDHYVIFIALLDDITEAVKRSKASRQRGAEKRARRLAEEEARKKAELEELFQKWYEEKEAEKRRNATQAASNSPGTGQKTVGYDEDEYELAARRRRQGKRNPFWP